jgi:hypothetical protein
MATLRQRRVALGSCADVPDRILTRHDRIRLLLESAYDYLPPVQIARYGQQSPLYSDPMINQSVQDRNDDQTAADGRRANQRELERLRSEASDRAGDATDHLFRRREALYSQGDYARLHEALANLKAVDAYSHRVLQRTYLDCLNVASWIIVEGCIWQLGQWMPDPVRIPAWLSDRAGETLHVRIRICAAEHPAWSQQKIAKRCGCDRSTVSRALTATKKVA